VRRGVYDRQRPALRQALPWFAIPAFLIVTLALATASRPWFTAGYLAAVVTVIGLLAALGWLVRWASSRLSPPANPFLRLAIAGFHRPGAGTIGLVVALGVGLAMFVESAAVPSGFEANLERDLPERRRRYSVAPPETSITAPLMYDASSEARNA